MRGVGGPLLCIGDLLCDVADADDDVSSVGADETTTTTTITLEASSPSDLDGLFEEHYDELVKALEGNDHSWTNLMLKLCDTLKIADKLVASANSNVEGLFEKVAVLESILKKGDSIVKSLQNVHVNSVSVN
ncbi:hypothetical protein LUZ60_008172 [Juncus effusus]|nr:hypothetical protein LUZ60_008172 [Juncus effusus]